MPETFSADIKYVRHNFLSPIKTFALNDIRQLILKWALNEARVTLDIEFNILAYCKKNQKTKCNWLYEISQVVYGAAFSSVKAERDFSGFALV